MFIWDKKNQDQVLEVIMKEMKPISPSMARESFGQVMRVNHEGWFRKDRLYSGAHRSGAGKQQGDPAGPGQPGRSTSRFWKKPKESWD